ncbi:MAG TPA: hypothetical protein VGV41_02060 [Pseudolabrys sp.]|uniref:hypothetical protein n=1 Tax=Pseudolabrys sp. TaxID=1960880 RepID=UPI002DDD645D|nr:hypothetical protein [Pseudolabrys sp.]HEV2627416.1 hypothetical protein [Pseudolabrys sp.]
MSKSTPQPVSEVAIPYRPEATWLCTDAMYRFVVEYKKILDLFWCVVDTAHRIDQMQAIAAHALADPADREKGVDGFNKRVMFQRVQELSEQISRNLVIGMVNNFHCYLSELLQEVMLKRPEILRSSERVTTEDVLQFARVRDIRSFLADRKVSELSYGGLRQTREFISDRLGVELFSAEEQERLLTIFVEIRNVHTHNRGVVNRLFLNRIHQARHPKFVFKIGQFHQVGFDEFVLLSNNCVDVSRHLDAVVAAKFKLKRSRYKTRDKSVAGNAVTNPLAN